VVETAHEREIVKKVRKKLKAHIDHVEVPIERQPAGPNPLYHRDD